MPEMVYDSGNFGVERERVGYLPSCLCTLALQHHVTPVGLIFIKAQVLGFLWSTFF